MTVTRTRAERQEGILLERNLKSTAATSADTPATTAGPAEAASSRIPAARILGAYKQMLAYLFGAAVIVIGLLIISTLPFFLLRVLGLIKADPSSVFLVVVLAGSLGALFSALIRLYNFKDLPKALVDGELEGLPAKYLLMYSLVPIVVGAIAAAVLYVVFAGKMITNSLFPEFSCLPVGDKCETFVSFLTYWGPKGPEDFAKILVWGFVAGFAERLVPDTLQTLTRSTSSNTEQSDASGRQQTGPSKPDATESRGT